MWETIRMGLKLRMVINCKYKMGVLGIYLCIFNKNVKMSNKIGINGTILYKLQILIKDSLLSDKKR